MGSSGASSYTSEIEETVAPAVAKSVAEDTVEAQAAQADARARRKGISSTYNRFAAADASGNGSATKLG